MLRVIYVTLATPPVGCAGDPHASWSRAIPEGTNAS